MIDSSRDWSSKRIQRFHSVFTDINEHRVHDNEACKKHRLIKQVQLREEIVRGGVSSQKDAHMAEGKTVIAKTALPEGSATKWLRDEGTNSPNVLSGCINGKQK